ncbi:hypothetical protein Trydic_g4731 [Trypoxylus dichotomus]
MPRRGRSAPAPRASPRSHSPSPNLPARAPVAAPAPAAPVAAAPQQPGLLGQMAATAGGVAIGSAVGHTIGHAMTGMFSGGGNDQPAAAPAQQAAAPTNQYAEGEQNGPCAWEIKQFLQCASNQSDLTLCQGFNEAIQQCKMRYNIA